MFRCWVTDDVNGDGDIDAKGNMFSAEDVAFGGGEVPFDFVVGKIVELKRGELSAEAFDDAGDGIVDGRVLADVGAGRE